MVYDEANDVYRPRYGHKSIKSVIDETPVEIKQGMDPMLIHGQKQRKRR